MKRRPGGFRTRVRFRRRNGSGPSTEQCLSTLAEVSDNEDNGDDGNDATNDVVGSWRLLPVSFRSNLAPPPLPRPRCFTWSSKRGVLRHARDVSYIAVKFHAPRPDSR